jgi:methionyl-tRNA formyltransferase
MVSMSLRLIFMGTPDFAVPTLRKIVGSGHKIVAVYTSAAKRAGRGMEPTPSPVEREARGRGFAVHTPLMLRSEEVQATFRSHDADVAVVVAYGLILPRQVLDAPRLGCFNVHASLLPRWRGAAPINRAIMAGDTKTGITIMKMDEGLDTGPIAKTKSVRIPAGMTAGELHDELARLGANLMLDVLDALERGALSLKPQVGYAAKIDKDETRIDWTKPWRSVRDQVHGLSPFPGAWCEITADGTAMRIKVLSAKYAARGRRTVMPGTVLDDRLRINCGEGSIRILQLQRAGKQPMQAKEFLRGTPISAGQTLE